MLVESVYEQGLCQGFVYWSNLRTHTYLFGCLDFELCDIPMTDKLAEACAEVNKRFGRGSIMPLNQSTASDPVEAISTGNSKIDAITGIGGIPKGRVTEVFGPESGGKTTLTLQIIAQAQKAGGTAVFIDAENALDMEYARVLGVDTDRLLVSQPDCGEDALEIAQTMIRSGMVAIVVVDSVAALVPRAELEGDMGDAQMGLQARLMSQAMRKLNGAVKTTNTALVFINQVRDKLGVMFGSPETTTGGRALKFYSSLRIDIRRIAQKKKGDVVIGNETKVKIAKNKMSAPFREEKLLLTFGAGFIND
jgi:recombination protein RecA